MGSVMGVQEPSDDSRHHGRPEARPPSDPREARDPAEAVDEGAAFEAMRWLLRFDGDTSRLSESGLTAVEWAGSGERDIYLIRGAPKRNLVHDTEDRVWVGESVLKARGWTTAAIGDFLPEAEGFRLDPQRPGAGEPEPVWLPETVAEAEATTEWQWWLRESLRRRCMTPHELASVADDALRPRLEAVQEAVDAYLRAQIVRRSTGGSR
jgi:hypothetical protein